jgi:hypothetical protein
MNKIRDQISKMVFCSINKENILSISIYRGKCKNINDIKKVIFPQAPNKRNKKQRKTEKNLKMGNKFIKSKKNGSKKIMPNSKDSKGIKNHSSCLALNKRKTKTKSIIIPGTKIDKNKKYKNDSPKVFLNKSKNKRKNNNQLKYSEFELDDLDYLEAIKYDKRTFIEFFLCLVKREHLIIFTFIFCSDLNLLCVKLVLFIFSVNLDFATNVLFFNDDSMHKIYLDYGKYNFISQIPQIIYSTIISEAFDVFLKYLTLSEKEIYKISKVKKLKIARKKVSKLIRKFKIKFFCFFSITFILLSFFWYFITAFCAVYKNTQIILFKDFGSSFLISITYPFALYLIPAALRIIALRRKKEDQKCLYILSNIFPLF